jgi:hypothetical protein
VITHIDVCTVLEHAGGGTSSSLVTRSTGAAVREAIERRLARDHRPRTTVMDFSRVALLDYSCADEVIAKLLLRFAAQSADEMFFVVRGLDSEHVEALESVLERHELALVFESDDGHGHLLGHTSHLERAAWDAAHARGECRSREIAGDIGVDATVAATVMERMYSRRLVMRGDEGHYMAAHWRADAGEA